jgi:hypothetical protein
MAGSKYTEETINKLLEAALKQRLNSPHYYLDNLYIISMNGMVDRYREKIDSSLQGVSYLNAMVLAEKIQYVLVEDINKFKQLSITDKANFFRISNLASINPENYTTNEAFLKEVGSVAGNHFREASQSIYPDEIKQYALLTSRTRSRFMKIYESQLNEINQIFKDSTVEIKPVKKTKITM